MDLADFGTKRYSYSYRFGFVEYVQKKFRDFE